MTWKSRFQGPTNPWFKFFHLYSIFAKFICLRSCFSFANARSIKISVNWFRSSSFIFCTPDPWYTANGQDRGYFLRHSRTSSSYVCRGSGYWWHKINLLDLILPAQYNISLINLDKNWIVCLSDVSNCHSWKCIVGTPRLSYTIASFSVVFVICVSLRERRSLGSE